MLMQSSWSQSLTAIRHWMKNRCWLHVGLKKKKTQKIWIQSGVKWEHSEEMQLDHLMEKRFSKGWAGAQRETYVLCHTRIPHHASKYKIAFDFIQTSPKFHLSCRFFHEILRYIWRLSSSLKEAIWKVKHGIMKQANACSMWLHC